MKKIITVLCITGVFAIAGNLSAYAGNLKLSKGDKEKNASEHSLLSLKTASSGGGGGDKVNAVKLNFLSLVFKTVNLTYERGITEKASLQLGFFYTGYSISGTSFSGFGITPEYRYHLSDKGSIQGFYVAPFLRYQSFTLKEEGVNTYDTNGNLLSTESKGTLSTIGGGALVGNQWLFGDVVTFDVFLGPVYNSGSVKVTEGNESDFSVGSFSGFTLRFGLTAGVAF